MDENVQETVGGQQRLHLTLPDKLGTLIREAIQELERVEATEGLLVKMGVYLELHPTQTIRKQANCAMCLAGSLMYARCPEIKELTALGRTVWVWPSDYPREVEAKLRFLSDFQFGSFLTAFDFLKLPLPPGFPEGIEDSIPAYEDDPAEYKKTLLYWAGRLKELDL